VSVPDRGPPSVSTVIMRYRLLTGLAVAPWTFVVVAAGPADAASGIRVAAEVTEHTEQPADKVGTLAGGMVVAAGVAFAGTAMVRRRKDTGR